MSEKHITLKLIPAAKIPKLEARGLGILDADLPNGETVIVRNEDETEPIYDCGSCGSPLLVGIQPGQMRDVVLRCSMCRAYNDGTT